MTLEIPTVPPVPTVIGGTALRCVWNVEADSTYDIGALKARTDSKHLRPEGGTGMIAVRTLEGAGRVYLGEDVFDVRAGSLLVVEWDRLTRYHCRGEHWRFWWFEFDVLGPVTLPHHRVLAVPTDDAEPAALDRMLANLRMEDGAHRQLACSQFQTMLLEWIARRTDRSQRSRHDERVGGVIAAMYDRLDGTFSLADMARMAHVSQPQLRRLFRAATGESPKKFYDRLRLAWAEHMLRTERKNVSEVAHSLGYCSPFHFSRVFRNHFGFPPSELLRSDR